MTQFLILAITFAGATSRTLPLDLGNDGHDRPVRPIAECQWRADDLRQTLLPDAFNVGAGSVLKINARPEIKMLRDKMFAEWERVERLTAYVDNRDIECRYHDLQEMHFENNVFYETTDHLVELNDPKLGLALAPGDDDRGDQRPGAGPIYLFQSDGRVSRRRSARGRRRDDLPSDLTARRLAARGPAAIGHHCTTNRLSHPRGRARAQAKSGLQKNLRRTRR